MAFLDISSTNSNMNDDYNGQILNYKVVDDGSGRHAVYTIQIKVGETTWTVERRYSEFDAYNQKRFSDKLHYLPPKKLVGNLDPEFLEERKKELERYVHLALELGLWDQKKKGAMSLAMLTAKFFDFHQYEIHSIVDDLSCRLRSVGDEWLTLSTTKPKYFEFSLMEMYAITERLKLAEPTAPDIGVEADIGHTIDFLHNIKALRVRGGKGYVGSSNILSHTLGFSLKFCRNLLALWITDCAAELITDLNTLSGCLRRLVVHYSIKRLEDLLLDDVSPVPLAELKSWNCLEEADFSFNFLEEIDESVRLLGPVVKMNFSHNHLNCVGPHLQHLTNLTELDLSNNSIATVERWNEKLGNLKRLILSSNSISSIEGLGKLFSLEYLDLKDNRLATADSIKPIGRLPCLETLILRGNPVRKTVDYRSRVLEAFGTRCKEITLDSRKPDNREMDMVRVRLALRRAKEEHEERERRKQEKIEEKLRYISGEMSSSLSISHVGSNNSI